MTLSLVLLLLAFLTLWVTFHSTKDIYKLLAGLTTVITFIWGFSIAPLPLQVVIVLWVLGLEEFYGLGNHKRRAGI